MTKIRTHSLSFSGGEIAPELQGRVDLSKYQTGLAKCENFLVQPHGPITSRPGFEFISISKFSNMDFAVRLIPFVFSQDEALVIEMGQGYARLISNGGYVLDQSFIGIDTMALQSSPVYPTVTEPYIRITTNSAHPYTGGSTLFFGSVTEGYGFYTVIGVPNSTTIDVVPTTKVGLNQVPCDASDLKLNASLLRAVFEFSHPYQAADLPELRYIQSADVMTLTHPEHPPRELRRLAALDWEIAEVDFGPKTAPPTNLGGSVYKDAGTTAERNYVYVVTHVDPVTGGESLASETKTFMNNLGQFTNFNKINWTASVDSTPGDGSTYRVYRQQSGVFGFIGETQPGYGYFDDYNIQPDTLRTPPDYPEPFDSANNYPSSVSYFDQRRVFASTNNSPQDLWFTRPGAFSNLSGSTPVQDDDGINFRIASRQFDKIQHVVPLGDLLLLTAGGEWRVYTGSGNPVTPSTIMARPQSYVGASPVQPVVTSLSAIYCASKGSRFRELLYDASGLGSYKTEDLSVLAPHLVDGYDIIDMAFTKAPIPTLWAVRSDGALLSLTYLPEQEVRAWHVHKTDGEVKSICAIPEGNEEAVYVSLRRDHNGYNGEMESIERLRLQHPEDQVDAFCVDSGGTFRSTYYIPKTDTIGGLWHLEGREVAILGDGAEMPRAVVTNGQVKLPVAVDVAHVGIPYEPEVETLPLTVDAAGMGMGYVKNINKVYMRVNTSRGVWVGPSLDELTEHKHRTDEPWGAPPRLITGEIEVPIRGTWTTDGKLVIKQKSPLPLTIQSMSMEVEVGGTS